MKDLTHFSNCTAGEPVMQPATTAHAGTSAPSESHKEAASGRQPKWQHLQRKRLPTSLLDGALQHNGALIKAILLDDLAVMEHVKLLSGVLASKHHDGLLAARVLAWEPNQGYVKQSSRLMTVHKIHKLKNPIGK